MNTFPIVPRILSPPVPSMARTEPLKSSHSFRRRAQASNAAAYSSRVSFLPARTAIASFAMSSALASMPGSSTSSGAYPHNR